VYRTGNVATPKRDLVWIDPSGARVSLGVKPGGYITPRLSPDGKRVALLVNSGGQTDLWSYDIARRAMTRLTFGNEGQCCPVWTPDGEFLLFSANGGLAWVRSDGAGKVELAPPANSESVPWSISGDGAWLAFHRNSPGTATDIWAARIERNSAGLRVGEPKNLVRRAGIQAAPALSPDARWFAHGSDESGRIEIYVVPFSPTGPARQGRWQISTEGFYGGARWCGKCQMLFYRGSDRRVWAVPYAVSGDSFLAGKASVWSDQRLADVGIFPNFDPAPDGKRVLAVVDIAEPRPDETHLRLMLNVEDELRRRLADH
jgi:hypothetical protein